MVSGERFHYTDPKMKELVRLVSDVTASLNLKPSIGFVFPILRDIFPWVDYLAEKSGKMEVIFDAMSKTHDIKFFFHSGNQILSKESYSRT